MNKTRTPDRRLRLAAAALAATLLVLTVACAPDRDEEPAQPQPPAATEPPAATGPAAPAAELGPIGRPPEVQTVQLPPMSQEELVARGEYLVEGVAACGNCHTPRNENLDFVEDMKFAGAFVIEEPEFTSYAANITPDPETGIGNWTDEEIARAVREGVRPDGRVLGPPMAFPFYRYISDTDIRAIVAYLRTVPPVRNEVPDSEYHIPLPPEWGPPVANVPDISREDTVGYGWYLAGPLGHCTDCHTPLVMGQHDFSRIGLGGTVFPQPFNAPWAAVSRNITPHPQAGLGNWTDEEIKRAIIDGVRRDGTEMVPFMAFSLYENMTEEDLDAIVAYLRTLPPLPQ